MISNSNRSGSIAQKVRDNHIAPISDVRSGSMSSTDVELTKVIGAVLPMEPHHYKIEMVNGALQLIQVKK